ncbi:ATP-binding cassette sub-family C member 9-like isoform X2 [Anneissia japonica]|uniref:ATP-binding cassette sub-family C member 9-like isoform X2 n=1 Tax=Anneissia japonica TaxID=1529436 RepID=UPI0014258175|nr:ATP-binding cassette sub-family C member 9-like isoform X2 [Anneissia japonica]
MAVESGSEKWKWFCGKNSSDLVFFDDFEWKKNFTYGNACFMSAVYTIPHALFIVVFILVLACLFIFSPRNLPPSKYLIRFPGHVVRWLVSSLLLVVLFASIGEGILTDQTFEGAPTQPHLYLTGCCSVVTVILSLMVYQMMEIRNAIYISLVLSLYWILAIGVEAFRLVGLDYMKLASIETIRFNICLLSLAGFTIILLVELYVFQGKIYRVCCVPYGGILSPSEFPVDDMLYKDQYSNAVSQISFWWLNWLLRLGYKRPLEISDLGSIPDDFESRNNLNKFKEAFEKEKKRAESKNVMPSLWRVFAVVYGRGLLTSGIFNLIGNLLSFVGPLVVGAIVTYVTKIVYFPDSEVKVSHYVTTKEYFDNGFILVGVMFFAGIGKFVCIQSAFHLAILESLKVRVAIQAVVYEKSLALSTFAITGGAMTMGQITNHMSTDAMSLVYIFQLGNQLWSIPVIIAVTLALLYQEMGVSALIGASVFLVTFPIQIKIGALMSKIQKETMVFSDERLKLSNELLQGIKLLKVYGWEKVYADMIEGVRANEFKCMKRMGVCTVFQYFFVMSSPVMVTLLSFSLYSKLEGVDLKPDIAFSSLALFQQLTVPLFLLPMTLAFLVNAIVSTNRLRNFLIAPEIEKLDNGRQQRQQKNGVNHHMHDDKIPNVDFKFPGNRAKSSVKKNSGNSEHLAFQNYDDKSKLTSSGKHVTSYGSMSTSLSATPNDVPDDVTFTIRNGDFCWDLDSNIPCISDINVDIPAGRLTIIVGQVGSGKSSLIAAALGEMRTKSGEVQWNRNKNSVAYGSQKAWLVNASLRDNILFGSEYEYQRYERTIEACALKPDIEILPGGDQTEIGEKGINLSGGQKQRVSIARTVYSDADVIILDDPLSALDVHVGSQVFNEGIMGLLIEKGKTVVLVTHQIQYVEFAHQIIVMDDGKVLTQGTLDEIRSDDPELYRSWQKSMAQKESESEMSEIESADEERMKLKKQISIRESAEVRDQISKKNSETGKLIEEEEIVRGSVSYKMYFYYINAMGKLLAVLVLVSCISVTGMMVGTNFWLSEWSEAGIAVSNDTRTTKDYILGYTGLSISSIVLSMVSSVSLVFVCLYAAQKLFLNLLRNVINVPVRFFDVTPVGRILNRFSNDTQVIDVRLNQLINGLIRSTVSCVAALIVNTIVVPVFIAIVFPVMIIYYIVQKFFIATSRELQRLDSITKSPVFAYFSETLGGLITIRAYKSGSRFQEYIMEKINLNSLAYLYLQTCNRWLAVRLVSGYLNWVIRNMADTEMSMNAVERVSHYTNLESEPYEGSRVPPLSWPDKGDIDFRDISVRYARDLDPVLKSISLHFKPGEKVGICGRTGSGKSSLTLTLFRVIDTFKGCIVIDDFDIAHVPLRILRQRLSIIPQDPVLFTGTIRYNLDPQHLRTDQELWEAIEIAQLKDVVSGLEGSLDYQVSEGGENFSVGQRQLFCLARAFLRKSQILIMDEATASIDMQTDQILQKVVASAFKDKTVLTIAHRVSTIIDYDTILVLGDGEVKELDSPKNLLARDDSIFSSLVKSNK